MECPRCQLALPAADRLCPRCFPDTAAEADDDAATTVCYREPVDESLSAEELELANGAGCRLLRRLGRGGMGSVYQAVQISMDRPVALKVLHARESKLKQRFLEEGRAAARLNHENIVQVYDVGLSAARPYLLMEYVEGQSLTELFASKTLELAQLLQIARGLACALAYAHAKKVVHRDLKPSNVLVSKQGAVKLVDLGLAKRQDAGGVLTGSGTMLGTPSYMAPEQARDPRNAGPAADVYGFGATMYSAVYGKPPFEGRNAVELVQRALREPPRFPRWPGVPENLIRLLQVCLRKRPSERYPDGAALLASLERVAGGLVPSDPSRRMSVAANLELWWVAGLLSLALLVALAVVAC